MTKRAIVRLVLVLSTVLILCTSCNKPAETKTTEPKLDDNQVRAILEELVPKAEEVIKLMFNTFFQENDPEQIETSQGVYAPVKVAGFETTQDVKDVVFEVFTKERADIIIKDIFEPVVDSSQRVFGARLTDINNKLYINCGSGKYGEFKTWVISDASIIEQNEYRILVKIPIDNTTGGVTFHNGFKEMELVKENGEWKINSAMKNTNILDY